MSSSTSQTMKNVFAARPCLERRLPNRTYSTAHSRRTIERPNTTKRVWLPPATRPPKMYNSIQIRIDNLENQVADTDGNATKFWRPRRIFLAWNVPCTQWETHKSAHVRGDHWACPCWPHSTRALTAFLDVLAIDFSFSLPPISTLSSRSQNSRRTLSHHTPHTLASRRGSSLPPPYSPDTNSQNILAVGRKTLASLPMRSNVRPACGAMIPQPFFP